MTITEIRDALTKLIDAGYSKGRLWDDNDKTFQITGIIEKDELDANGDMITKFYFEVDEVPK